MAHKGSKYARKHMQPQQVKTNVAHIVEPEKNEDITYNRDYDLYVCESCEKELNNGS